MQLPVDKQKNEKVVLSGGDSLVVKLYRSPKNVLTMASIAMLWGETDPVKLKNKISYYVRTGVLARLTRGIFVKSRNYNAKELAGNIYTPSYISFETVLREAGIIFQYYDTVFAATQWTKRLKVDKKNFSFRKIKDIVLFNKAGILAKDNYNIATPERAFLDMIYLYPGYYFDNLKFINWDKCFELVKIYKNKEMVERLKKYKKNYLKTKKRNSESEAN